MFQSAEEQTVLMNDGDYHGRGDWRRSRNSESGGPLGDDMETSYVPSSAYLSGHHRGRYVSYFLLSVQTILVSFHGSVLKMIIIIIKILF